MTSKLITSSEFQCSVDDALERANALISVDAAAASTLRLPSMLASMGTVPAHMLANSCDRVDAACGIASHAFVSCVTALVSSLRTQLSSGERPSVLSRELTDSTKQVAAGAMAASSRIGFDVACTALRRVMSHRGMSMTTCDAAIEATRIAGLTGRVRTELCPAAHTDTIELTHGHTFNAEAVLRTNDVTPWTAANTRCMFVDGIIESVAEIDGVLHRAHSSQEPLFICARGYGDDVVSTIAANRARRTLDVHIVRAPFDIDGANMLKDMAMTVGSDVVSSLQGSLISAVRFDDLKRADKLVVIGGTATISSSGSSSTLRAHVAELAKLRDACTVPAMSAAYSDRIKSLSGARVSLKLCGTKRECATKLYEADSALRAMRMLLSHGRSDDMTCGGSAFAPTKAAAVSAAGALMDTYGMVPAAMLVVVLNAAVECAAALCLSAGIVALDAS